jgi:hypothetical protein
MSRFGMAYGDALGRYQATDYGNARAQNARLNALVAPYDQAIQQARGDASRQAMSAAQTTGNAFLARRSAGQASERAAAPLLAQRSAAQAQAVQGEIDYERQRRLAEQQRMDRFLGAGLSAGASGLAGLLQMVGGGGPEQGTTSGLPGATMTGGNPQPQTVSDARFAELKQAQGPQPMTNPAVSAAQAQAQAQAPGQPGVAVAPMVERPSAQQPLYVAPRQTAPIMNAGQTLPPSTPGLHAQAMGQAQGGTNPMGDFGSMLSGAAPWVSMVPGWGQLAGLGMGGLGALLRQ